MNFEASVGSEYAITEQEYGISYQGFMYFKNSIVLVNAF